jgi:glycosyltransferase involved in cell wall biosynthesis
MKEKLTIITVTRNDLDGLILTAKSILPKLSVNVNWVIVDGSSTDGTPHFISSLKEHLYWHISEVDGGIYDAMNKGALHSPKDSFLIWINSGDQLLSVPEITNQYDSYFCGVIINETGFVKLPFISTPFGVKSISPCSQYFHQGYIVKRDIFLRYMYNLDVGLSGDMLLMLQTLKYHNFFVYEHAIAIYNAEGQSNKKIFKLLSSHIAVVKFFKFSIFSYLILNKLFFVKCILKMVFPFSIVVRYRKLISRKIK